MYICEVLLSLLIHILTFNIMTIHDKINLKSEVEKLAIRKGEKVPYSSRLNPCNYAIDISYWGCISPVGTDPESQTIYRNYLIEFSEIY